MNTQHVCFGLVVGPKSETGFVRELLGWAKGGPGGGNVEAEDMAGGWGWEREGGQLPPWPLQHGVQGPMLLPLSRLSPPRSVNLCN